MPYFKITSLTACGWISIPAYVSRNSGEMLASPSSCTGFMDKVYIIATVYEFGFDFQFSMSDQDEAISGSI
jgi:hypothetical protein